MIQITNIKKTGHQYKSELLKEEYRTIVKHYAHKIDISDEVDQSLKNTNYQNK